MYVLDDTGGSSGGSDSEIFDGYIDATDQQRNTALANVSNQTANSTTGKMGYKVLDPTKTFAQQVTAENTIYEIRDVFDLSGTQETPVSVTLPTGSTLKFNGGLIKNCTLNGNQTTIDASNVKIIDNVKMNGTFRNNEAPLSWFGCVNGENVDNSDCIQLAANSSFKCLIVDGIYYISHTIIARSKTFKSDSISNYKQFGFYANDDFQGIDYTTTYRGEIHNLHSDGMFCFHYDQHPIFRGIFIDARKKAKYCLEETSIDGFSSSDLYNVYIKGALVCGILQYGCERPVFEDVYVSDCHVGIFVSTNIINENDVLDFTGTNAQPTNLVNFRNVRVLNCNYGFVLNGSYNTSMYSCETGYNYITGLYVNKSFVTFTDFYSEGDGMCHKYIASDGSIIEGTVVGNKMSVPSDLIELNKDGFSSQELFVYTQSIVYFRSPIVLIASTATFVNLVTSNYPRGTYKLPEPFNTKDLPDIRTYAGVDSIMLLASSDVTICGCHKIYIGSNNYSANTNLIGNYIILNGVQGSITDSRVVVDRYTRGKGIIYASINYHNPNVQAIIPNKSYVSIDKSNIYLPPTTRTKIFDFSNEELVEYFNGIPLYKLSGSSTTKSANFSISNINKIFGDNLQYLIVIYFKVINEQSTGKFIDLQVKEFHDSSHSYLLGTYTQSLVSYEGYFRMVIPVTPTVTKEIIYNNIYFYLYLPADKEDFLFSEPYVFDIGDDIDNFNPISVVASQP